MHSRFGLVSRWKAYFYPSIKVHSWNYKQEFMSRRMSCESLAKNTFENDILWGSLLHCLAQDKKCGRREKKATSIEKPKFLNRWQFLLRFHIFLFMLQSFSIKKAFVGVKHVGFFNVSVWIMSDFIFRQVCCLLVFRIRNLSFFAVFLKTLQID